MRPAAARADVRLKSGTEPPDERRRPPPRTADPHDRGRQLVARPPGGARGDRARGRGGARDRCVLRVPVRRAVGRARPPGDARDGDRGRDERPAHAERRGDHGGRRCRARTDHDRRAGTPRPTVQGVSEPAGGPVRVDPRGADPGPGRPRRRAQRPHARSHGRSPPPRSRSRRRSPRRSASRSSTRSSTPRRVDGSRSSRRSRGSPRRSRSRCTSRSRSRRS